MRVVELEARTLQRLHEIDLGAFEVEHTGLVDENLETIVVVGLVQHVRLVLESHRVTEARTASAYHRDPQSARGGFLRSHDLFHLANCPFRKLYTHAFHTPDFALRYYRCSTVVSGRAKSP